MIERLFADLVGYTDAHAGGSFTLFKLVQPEPHQAAQTGIQTLTKPEVTLPQRLRGFSIDGNVLTLDAGADPGTYTVQARYTDLDGNLSSKRYLTQQLQQQPIWNSYS